MALFNIYSIGDADFLEQIFISVAMIAGTGDLKQLVSIGLLLGAIMISFQSLIQGAKEINFQQVLIGWVMYACFFGPSSTVTIEDGYTGEVRAVANVPIGVGFTGAAISSIGYKITKLFEQGYSSVTSVTQKPFAEPLKILNETRRRSYDSAVFQSLNSVNGGGAVDFRRSWDNYIRECTLTKLDLGLITVEQMFNQKYSDAFKFDSSLYGTKLYLTPGDANGTDYSCTDAWPVMINATSAVNTPQVQQVLGDVIGIRSNQHQQHDTFLKISDALTALEASSVSASNFTIMAILEPLYFDAVMGKYQDMQDFSSAVMVNQAIMQRNAQWATEHTMFMTVVRPAMTFFEGFVYAITPIMAFVVVLGSTGISMIGKYFQTVLWIQLWMPVLSIINLYIMTVASGQVSRFAAGSGIESMYAMNDIGSKLDSWIAMGGMLASATPVISLFIVTGSSYAFTTLATRIGGADHVDEKLSAPDALKNGPVGQMTPTFNGNQFSGFIREGTQSLMSGMSFGSNLSAGVSSSQANMQQAQRAFGETLSRGITSGVSESDQFGRMVSLGQTVNSMNTNQAQAIRQKVDQIGEQFGLDKTMKEAVTGAIAAEMSGGVSSGNLSSIAKLNAGMKKSTGDISEGSVLDKNSKTSSFTDGLNFSEGDTSAFSTGLAHAITSNGGNTLASTWGDTSAKQLSESASNLLSSSQTYQNISQLQESLGSASQMDMKTLAGAVADSPEAVKSLNNAMLHAPQSVKQEAADLERRYERWGLSQPRAQAAARLTALTNTGNYSQNEAARHFRSAAQSVALATGRNLAPDSEKFDSGRYSGIDTVKNEGLNNYVNSATIPASTLQIDNDRVGAIQDQSKSRPDNSAIYTHNEQGRDQVDRTRFSGANDIAQNKYQQAVKNLIGKDAEGGTKPVMSIDNMRKKWDGAKDFFSSGTSDEHRNRHLQEAHDFASRQGLTDVQSNLYAASRYGTDEQFKAAYIDAVKPYTEGGEGKKFTSYDQYQIASHLTSNIIEAGRSGDRKSVGILLPVVQLNNAEKPMN